MKSLINWSLSIFVVVVFAQSLVFKFSGATETVIIFSTIASWMTDIGISRNLSFLFANYGAYAVGSLELVSAVLIVVPKTRVIGALSGAVIISGAIFFHLATPLGIDRVIDAAGNTDGGGLFYTASALLVANMALIALNRQRSVGDARDLLEPHLA